jgi:hypothetical protein
MLTILIHLLIEQNSSCELMAFRVLDLSENAVWLEIMLS